MNENFHNTPQKIRETSILRRLALSIVLVVVITVTFGGLTAIWMVWLQLEQQVWARVQDAQTATQALYDAEQDRMENLAALMARNPTLCSLVQRQDMHALGAYLDDLQKGSGLDALFMIASDQQRIGHATLDLPTLAELSVSQDPPFADFITLNDPFKLLIVAVAEVLPAEECEQGPGGWLIIARDLNNDFMQTLAQQTGLDQSLIVGRRQVATSLSNAPELALNPNIALDVLHTGTSCCTSGTSNGEQYYIGLAPLRNNSDDIIALSEVALPGGTIRAEALRTTILLVGVGVVGAVSGAILAIMLTRRITQPLTHLAEAAERMGADDLQIPITISSDLAEINQLAAQLDRARRHLQHAQLASKSEREWIEHLLEAIHDGVIVLDDEDHVTFFNSNAERLLGLSTRDVIGTHYSKVFRSVPNESITVRDVVHPRAGTPPVQHLTVIGANECPVTLAIAISWLNDNSSPNQSRERVLVVRDISEEEAVNQLRSHFLTNVSHEFRTPLSAVIATTEMLIEESSSISSDEIIELANTTRLGTLRLQTLVDNLLESAIIDAGYFRVRCRPVHIRDIINSANETMDLLLKRRDQRLLVDIPEGLPAIWADPERLAQVLINLLANASKFSPMGMAITLSVNQDHDALIVDVSDSGPGLPAGRFADLFKRFVTGEHPDGAQYGIGLGLSVVKAIVESHGGQVGAENRVEGGAKVWFTLPLNPPENC